MLKSCGRSFALTDPFILSPPFTRLDNGAQFVANGMWAWIDTVDAQTDDIKPRCPGKSAAFTTSTAAAANSCSLGRSPAL